MVNLQGREKKYPDREIGYTSIYLSEPFKDSWRIIVQLSEIDNDPEFLEYCKMVENADLSNRQLGRRGLYIRWILSAHAFNHAHKLGGAKT